MKNSPHHMKHARKKAIRSSQKEGCQTEKKQMKEEEIKKYMTAPKTNRAIRGKALSKKKSHKTSPADVTWATEPDSVHKEGKHWIKIIQKQTTHMALRLRGKLQKMWRKG